MWGRTVPAAMSTRNPSSRYTGPRKSLLKIRLQIHFFVFSSMRDISGLNLISDFRNGRARSAFIRPRLSTDDDNHRRALCRSRHQFLFRAIFWTSTAHFHFPFTRSLSHDTQNVILDCLSLERNDDCSPAERKVMRR